MVCASYPDRDERRGSVESWELVSNVAEAHDLLLRSDLAAGGAGGHVPTRNLESTRRHVRRQAIHGLRRDSRLVVAVTLSEDPTFAPNSDCTEASRPLYMCRLSVAPEATGPLLGYRAVRRIIGYAREHGYDVLRSEVNPDLCQVSDMLRTLGFVQRGAAVVRGGVATAQMELPIGGADRLG
jgi:hypothetical protein